MFRLSCKCWIELLELLLILSLHFIDYTTWIIPLWLLSLIFSCLCRKWHCSSVCLNPSGWKTDIFLSVLKTPKFVVLKPPTTSLTKMANHSVLTLKDAFILQTFVLFQLSCTLHTTQRISKISLWHTLEKNAFRFKKLMELFNLLKIYLLKCIMFIWIFLILLFHILLLLRKT